MRTALGELGDLEALQQVVEVAGLSLIEAGCAAGDTARGLAERGARELAVEPDPVQAKRNRAQPPAPRHCLPRMRAWMACCFSARCITFRAN